MITVLGSINIDLVARTQRLPRPGETVAGKAFTVEAGGKGANQALAARRAGVDVRFVGAVGQDPFADMALALLDEAGVDLRNVRRLQTPTGTALISVTGDGENAIIVVPGANGELAGTDVDAAIASMQEGDVLMLQLEIPVPMVERALVLSRQKGVTTILNLAPALPEASALAALADIVIANETEFQLLVGGDPMALEDLDAKLKDLHEISGQSFIVTMGAEGVTAIHEGQIHRAKGLTITPVDTVGAGDTFCGYLAALIAAHLPFPEALHRAAAAGSLACTRLGAQRAIPTIFEVQSAIG
ncbi:ribokinase [Brucella intermedia]|uniref:ribokinase n=1 Tax=Brucella intermedia TaxID=94625 RepID=UPI00224A6410|nr:ribokinase [Brucella intermedia]